MQQPNDYRVDRAHPPRVIYVEDEDVWVTSWGVSDTIKNGLGLSCSWYKEADHALLALTKESSLYEASAYVSSRRSSHSPVPKREEMEKVRSFLDPELLKNRIFISDNQTPGWLFGVHVINAIMDVSESLAQDQRPTILSLMCTDPKVVEDDPVLLARWDSYGAEAVHKSYFPFIAFWMSRVIHGEKSGERIRFWDWVHKHTGVSYETRTEKDHFRTLDAKSILLNTVLQCIREDLTPQDMGILARITDQQIGDLLQRPGIQFKEVPALLDSWRGASGSSENKSYHASSPECR